MNENNGKGPKPPTLPDETFYWAVVAIFVLIFLLLIGWPDRTSGNGKDWMLACLVFVVWPFRLFLRFLGLLG